MLAASRVIYDVPCAQTVLNMQYGHYAADSDACITELFSASWITRSGFFSVDVQLSCFSHTSAKSLQCATPLLQWKGGRLFTGTPDIGANGSRVLIHFQWKAVFPTIFILPCLT